MEELKPGPGPELTQISENRRANGDFALTLQIMPLLEYMYFTVSMLTMHAWMH